MRRTITIILVLAILGLIANDVWRWGSAAQALDNTTYDLTSLAAKLATPGTTREQVGVQLAQQAQPKGVTVYQYDQTDLGVRVWTQSQVRGTIVLGGIWNLANGVPAAEAFKTPFVIRDYGEAGIK